MRRFFPLLIASSAAAVLARSAMAQEAAPAQELRELRAAVQQQARQIEALAEQIGRLTRALEGPKAADAAVEVPRAAPEAAAEAAKTEAIPKAEAVPAGPRHVVAKGETLTSIARHYNIAVADLKNANKIEDERKLQIGQVLKVPPLKPAETPDKKDTP